MEAKVFVQKAAYDASLEGVVTRILDEFPLDWQGKKVLVKPNILAPCPPEKAVTTHPLLVAQVVGQLAQRGATVWVGDNSGVRGYGKLQESASITGILEASSGHFIRLGRHPVKHPVQSRFFGHLMISREVLEADVVVNLPKMKTHGLTLMTGAIKNTFGHLVGAEKMRVHSLAPTPRKFAEALVDIFQIRPPELNIMDAVTAHEGNGPSNGSPRHVGLILASRNAVSLDAVMVHLAGQAVSSAPMVAVAGERGLGETDIGRIALNMPITPIRDFKMPATYLPGVMGLVLNRFLSHSIGCLPEVLPKQCQACGICVTHCPTGAMKMAGGSPSVDANICIKCYCCQEMCPSNAIVFSGRFAALARKLAASLDRRSEKQA